MTSRQPNHRHDCPCNDCVRRRNGRRRREADRSAEEGRPLPQGSQLYEILRDLPPIYDTEPMPPASAPIPTPMPNTDLPPRVQEVVDDLQGRTRQPAVDIDTDRRIPPANPDDFMGQRAPPVHPAGNVEATPTPSQSDGGMKGWLFVLLFAVAIGGVAYCAVQSKLIEFNAPTVSLPALLPTETPTTTQPPPTKVPNSDATVMMPPTLTLAPTEALPTPTPTPTTTPVPTPTAEITTPTPTEREIVVNAFAECDGQYSGRDRQFRAQAANHAIDEGRQTVADIRGLVNKHCGGVFPELARHGLQPAAKPTATPVPTPISTLWPTPTILPTP